MAKYTLILFLVLVLLVVISFFGDFVTGQQQPQRPRTRSKVTSVKKKRIIGSSAVPLVTVTTPLSLLETTLNSIEDSEDFGELTTEPGPLQEAISTTISPTIPSSPLSKIPPKNFSVKSNKRATTVNKVSLGCDEECDKDECPSVGSCPTGLVLDWCECCQVCSVGVGNRCFNPSLKLPYNPDIGICGLGLICKLRSDLELFDSPEALCECLDERLVCGSDNQTYSSECKLRAEATQSKPNLAVASWRPCVSAPWISTPVENMTVSVNDEMALSCEIKGYPPPTIHWEFLPDDNTITSNVILPGDDSSVVVVVRGGPEQMMTTSWIQIIGVSPKRQGQYFCVAQNVEGLARSSAFVSVNKSTE